MNAAAVCVNTVANIWQAHGKLRKPLKARTILPPSSETKKGVLTSFLDQHPAFEMRQLIICFFTFSAVS